MVFNVLLCLVNFLLINGIIIRHIVEGEIESLGKCLKSKETLLFSANEVYSIFIETKKLSKNIAESLGKDIKVAKVAGDLNIIALFSEKNFSVSFDCGKTFETFTMFSKILKLSVFREDKEHFAVGLKINEKLSSEAFFVPLRKTYKEVSVPTAGKLTHVLHNKRNYFLVRESKNGLIQINTYDVFGKFIQSVGEVHFTFALPEQIFFTKRTVIGEVGLFKLNIPHGVLEVRLEGVQGRRLSSLGITSAGAFNVAHVSSVNRGTLMGDLFISDEGGTQFRFLRSDVAFSLQSGEFHFFSVKGFRGIYISNVYTHDSFDSMKKVGSFAHGKEFMETKITFDAGFSWQMLFPRAKDFRGEDHNFEEFVSLHLHILRTEHLLGLYHAPGSAATLMGQGNLGTSLSFEDSKLGLYLSRDAGLHWTHLDQGIFAYESSEAGIIIVYCVKGSLTSTLNYSLDEGRTFSKFVFHDYPIKVYNIITLLEQNSQIFVIQALRKEGEKEDKFSVVIDMSDLLSRVCNLKDDFELWTPKLRKKCSAGSQIYFNKKIRFDCRLPDGLELKVYQLPCLCKKEDYFCPKDYLRTSSNKCELQSTNTTEIIDVIRTYQSECFKKKSTGKNFFYMILFSLSVILFYRIRPKKQPTNFVI